MNKIKLFLASILTILGTSGMVLPLQHAFAQGVKENINCGASGQLLDGTCDDIDQGANEVVRIIEIVIRVFQIIVGLVSVFMIIWGGLKYILSQGEAGAVKTAKNTILYAILGLVIVAIAQFIVQFVLKRIE